MVRRLVLLVLVLLSAACVGAEPAAVDQPGDGPAASTTTAAPTTAPTEVPPCLEGELLFQSGPAIVAFGSGDGDGAGLGGIRWRSYGTCERVVLDFVTGDGAPGATPGSGSASVLVTSGIVRIELPPNVAGTAIADARFDGDLVERVFVVRDEDGTLFVDLHLATARPVALRAFALESPARAVIDLQPDPGEPVALAPPVIGDRIVITAPAPGPRSYPIEVEGYARTFEASVVARIYETGERIDEYATTAADWLDAWGAFRIAIPDGPEGEIELFVGEDNAADGSEVGVRLDLDMG